MLCAISPVREEDPDVKGGRRGGSGRPFPGGTTLEFFDQESTDDLLVTSSRLRVWWLTRFRGYRIVRMRVLPKSLGQWWGSSSVSWELAPEE